MSAEHPVYNQQAEQGVSAIPYVGGIISAFIGIGDFASQGRNFRWGDGLEKNSDNHSEAPPPGFKEGRDFYWEYGTWKPSGLTIEKWNVAKTLLGDQANQLAPEFFASLNLQELTAALSSTQPSTFIAPPNIPTQNVYAT